MLRNPLLLRLMAHTALSVPMLYRFFMDFGSPIGDHSGSLFHIFSDLSSPKSHLDSSHVFCWFLNWNSGEFWCPNPSKVLEIHMFSLDFTFSEFSWFWWLRVPLGTSFWWLLEVLGGHFCDFLVYWICIEISLIFRTSPSCVNRGTGR